MPREKDASGKMVVLRDLGVAPFSARRGLTSGSWWPGDAEYVPVASRRCAPVAAEGTSPVTLWARDALAGRSGNPRNSICPNCRNSPKGGLFNN